jgi:tetratricopeptide (TPR) repeat protein
MTGDVIGPYRLLAPIGKGAMGEVWRARDERLDRLVAVKLLPPDLAGDPERRARMLREARAAAAVAHGNVVTLYDIVQADGRDVLVMELVDGHTVAEILRRDGAPPLAQGLGWLIALTDALAAAHGRGILHRDIKAANVMVTVQGQIKVLDFGLAKLAEGDATMVSGEVAVGDAASASVADTLVSTGTGTGTGTGSYATRAGTLLGTPMYMAPEQIAGAAPDERTEVFSVGVLAFEVCAGKPPFKARSVDDLFAEISRGEAPRLADPVPDVVADVVARALAHDREARFPSMAAMHGALVAAREQLFGRKASRWPWLAAAAMVVGVLVAGTVWWLQNPPPVRAGDAYVKRALDEYDVFYGDKALSSLRAALRVDPTHPRALAYVVLFGGTPADRSDAVSRARIVVEKTGGKDQRLLRAVIALEEQGPAAAREVLIGGGATDHELRFWAAELAFTAGAFDLALPAYRELYAEGAKRFRGRIYDHYSGVLLWADEPAAAVEVGRRYHEAYPGEADAVGVHATVLASAGDLDRALALAEEAASLSRGEDTLAGLGKVRALRNELAQAIALYAESLSMAPAGRRPLRRAALALLQWMQGDAAAAVATVTPCLPGGADAALPSRAACLFVAAVVLPAGDPQIDVARAQLEALAAAVTPTRPPYGAPAALAALVRAHQAFTAGGCIGPRPPPPAELAAFAPQVERDLSVPLDFYAGYHVPFFATWAVCERAWLARYTGDVDRARALLHPVATRASGRWWLADDDAAL